MRISDWSSDVCSSDLHGHAALAGIIAAHDAAEPLIGAVEGSEAGGAPPEAVALGAQRAAGVDAGGNQEHAVVIGDGGPLQGGEQVVVAGRGAHRSAQPVLPAGERNGAAAARAQPVLG